MSTKYCINCKHFSPAENDLDHKFARCGYYQPVNLVTGQKDRDSMQFCSIVRKSTQFACGEEGRHFQEKEATNV